MKPTQSLTHKESKTIAFRVSAEDYDKIQLLIDISGMVKQDYLLSRALGREIIVHPNIRIQKYLEKHLVEISTELERINPGDGIPPAITDTLDMVLSIIKQL
jgi:nitrogen-specific signal transduction histidine kinase